MFELMGLLLLFMIIAAIVAIETRDLLASVISVTAVGFGLIIAFFYMRAPDVAIVPIVVEVLVLVILTIVWAFSLPWDAFAAFCLMEEVISSMVAATSSMAEACSCVA